MPLLRADFVAIDWIEAARQFERWRQSEGLSEKSALGSSEEHRLKREALLGSILGHDPEGPPTQPMRKQSRRFADLEPLVNFLRMLRSRCSDR